MKDVQITVKGITPYSASRPVDEPKRKDESHEDYDKRIWRMKAHTGADGNVIIPGVGFKLALDEAVARLNEKIKGKGNQTYTGLFRSGVVAMSDMVLGIKATDLKSITIWANLDGKRGGGKRGNRIFPIVPTWGGTIDFRIFNDSISESDFERFFSQAGMISGVGRGRPSMGCPAGNGRFIPVAYKWMTV